jgi:hypothetical protein
MELQLLILIIQTRKSRESYMFFLTLISRCLQFARTTKLLRNCLLLFISAEWNRVSTCPGLSHPLTRSTTGCKLKLIRWWRPQLFLHLNTWPVISVVTEYSAQSSIAETHDARARPRTARFNVVTRDRSDHEQVVLQNFKPINLPQNEELRSIFFLGSQCSERFQRAWRVVELVILPLIASQQNHFVSKSQRGVDATWGCEDGPRLMAQPDVRKRP